MTFTKSVWLVNPSNLLVPGGGLSFGLREVGYPGETEGWLACGEVTFDLPPTDELRVFLIAGIDAEQAQVHDAAETRIEVLEDQKAMVNAMPTFPPPAPPPAEDE